MPRPCALSTFTEYAETLIMKRQLLNIYINNKETKVLQKKLTLWTTKHSRNIYKLQIAEIGVYTGYACRVKVKLTKNPTGMD